MVSPRALRLAGPPPGGDGMVPHRTVQPLRFSYGFRMVFLRSSHGFLMVFIWFSFVFWGGSFCFLVVFVCFSYGFLMVFVRFSSSFARCSYGFRLVFMGFSCNFLMVVLSFSCWAFSNIGLQCNVVIFASLISQTSFCDVVLYLSCRPFFQV